MRSTPLVSIVLCTWNGERRLAEQVDSLLAQACGDFELIAVDDASTDATAQILHGYAARDARVHVVVNVANLGYDANFAGAFARCRGRFIAPCDQDDVWHPDKLAALAAAIGAADLAYCDSELIDADGGTLGHLSATRRMYEGADPLALVVTNSASGHAQLFRRELLARAQPFPPGIHYDWWLAVVAASGAGIRHLDQPLVRFRRHPAAATGIGRASARPPLREWLNGRRRLLSEMRRLDGPRQGDIVQLARALDDALDRGRWLPLARLVWRHRKPLSHIPGPRLPALVPAILAAALKPRD